MSFDSRYSRRSSARTFWSYFSTALIFSGIAGIILWTIGIFPFNRPAGPVNDPNVQQRAAVPRGQRNPDEIERIRIYRETVGSVVNVDTLAFAARNNFGDVQQQSIGTGTGFFWDDDGRIVTNFHVIRDALSLNQQNQVIINPDRKIIVTLTSGETMQGRLVGIAPDSDLAVMQLVRVPDGGSRKITVGTSDDLEVGQTVYAIGSPFGQKASMSEGIISALNRSIQSPTQHIISGVIQTDAALNPGNSGGPLLDKDGRLIGVNTAITSPHGGSVGIGYAIPVDTVNKVVTELIRTGRVAQPYIGAEFILEEAYVRRMGIAKGVVVRSVRPRSPAALAGMQQGDVIVRIDDNDISNLAALEKVLNRVKIGDALKVEVRRGNQMVDMAVKVEGI